MEGVYGKQGCDDKAGPLGFGAKEQQQKQEQGVGDMEKEIHQVVSGGGHPEKLTVHHV